MASRLCSICVNKDVPEKRKTLSGISVAKTSDRESLFGQQRPSGVPLFQGLHGTAYGAANTGPCLRLLWGLTLLIFGDNGFYW
ncbi:hypothetical protein J6590_094911 [Homalodisca vitripennis]|nr:hypothetical protein J6590_094911 [Homalodisca vitripennis]